MKKEKIKLSRPNKILLVMYELSNKRKKSLRFEDIVVALFKQYKEDFHMRGYPQYPDSFWSFKHALRFISKKAAVPPLGL